MSSAGKFYQIRQGDSAESLAAENGLLLETVWNHPENKELKELRKDPHILYPGDQLFVPDIQLKEVSAVTEITHIFVLEIPLSKLRVVILHNDLPAANERYVLQIEGTSLDGRTKSDGSVEKSISPTAKKARLILSPGENERILDLQLGGLDPITETSGVQGRLYNLGFPIRHIDNQMSKETIFRR